MALQDDVYTSKIALVGFLGAILLVVIIVGLQVVYFHAAAEQREEKDLNQPPTKLATLLAAQRAKLNEYHTLDPRKGVVRIPIDRAMSLVLAEEGSHGNAK